MGNKILGKRSRSFYRGFNERQISYLKDKFETISQNGVIKKELFMQAYKMSEAIYKDFIQVADFDEGGAVEEYEFICTVSYLCNLSVEQLGSKLFYMLTGNGKALKEADLLPFTEMCLKYNAYLEKKQATDIKKVNKNKFNKYDYDKSSSIEESEFCKICTKDEDYKSWLYNMGFITKKQMDFQDQVYDLVDSDIGDQVDRHLTQNNPNVDRIKRGIQHRMQGDDEFQVEQVAGEQYTPPNKHWIKDVQSFKQADFAGQLQENAPSQIMTLEYALGYRSFDSRNNLKFDSKDRIVTYNGALGIVMSDRPNRKGNERQFDQDFFSEHKDDITCVDIVGDTVVTGQTGSKPMIVLWETQKVDGNLRSSSRVTKELCQSIGSICLSSSKNLLAATCNDQDHKLVVYDLNELKQLQTNLTSTKTGILCCGPLTKSLVFDIKFAPDQKSLVAATVKEILFISFEKRTVNSSRGEFGNFSPSMALCLLPVKIMYKKEKRDFMLSGMGNGSIYFWDKDKCFKAIVGHSGSVSAICARRDVNSIISGDKTGKIIIWNDQFQKEGEILVPRTNCPSNMIIALSQSNKKQLLIGTKSSNAYLLKLGDSFDKARLVLSGHCDGTIWALAIHTSDPFMYTGGEDQRIIKWQYRDSKKAVAQVKCPYKIRSMDYNNYSKLLLVGFTNGIVQCYSSDTLQKQQKLIFNKIKNPDQQALNLVRFQHYGKYFIVCYSMPEYKIAIMGINDKEIKLITSIKFNQKIISVDLTKSKQNDVKYLRCNTEANKYEVYDISKEKPVKLPPTEKKYLKSQWDTHTVAFSPQTKGIFTGGVQEADITCCARTTQLKNVILIGDKYSKVKLFYYPTLTNKIFNKYEGHSNAVTAIQFNHKGDYVITVGGEEKSILIWKYDPVIDKNAYALQNITEDSDEEINNKKDKVKKGDEGDEFEQVVETGEQALAVSQFKGQTKAPSDFKPNPKKDNILPSEGIKIHHVFGIRSKYLKDEVRSQCRFSSNGKAILFPTACMAIKMDIATKQQEIFLQHKEDIVSFAVDKKRELMATGQMAQKNLINPLKKILAIYVWDIENKKVLQRLNGFHTIAIVLLEFSPSGKLLFSCGNDDKNTFAVYDWRAGSILYSGPVSKGKVNGICWRSETQFITCGNDHVKFWEQSKGRQGQFKSQTQSQVCCITSNNIYITGGAKGNLYTWAGSSSSDPIKAHGGKVQALFQKKSFIFSGGDDGKILRWPKEKNGAIKSSDLFLDTRSAFMDREVTLNEEEYGILSIDFRVQQSDQLIIATKGCAAIYHNKGKFQIVTQGHYKGELWALATNNKEDIFATGGDDGSVRCWDISKKQEVKRINFKDKIRAVDWSNDSKMIVVADAKAKIYLYDKNLSLNSEYTGKPYATNQGNATDGWVQQIKFSPDGQYIAYGTHGQSRVMQFLKLNGKNLALLKDVKAGTSAVLHIDWSTKQSVISLNTQAAELLFISTAGTYPSASSLRDQTWATWTQKFGFPVQGIFQGADYSDVNTVCRDPTKSFLAVGYDDQVIRLFKYPCYIPKQVFKTYYGHSSHVTRIRFSPHYMVSLGGEDKTIIVWQVEGAKNIQQQNKQEGYQSDGLDELDDDVDIPSRIMEKRKKKPKIQEFFEAADEGDQFMAVKPWLGAIKQPTYEWPKQTVQAPNVNIKLQYVHGYRTKDCRQNLYFCDDKTLIFHAAAVLIYHDTANNTQSLFTDHNDDILSIDYHKPSGGVLTGQLGPKPYVNYYKDSVLTHTFKSPVTKGVLAVAISPDGRRAVCSGMDEDHTIALLSLDSKQAKILSVAKGGKKVILKLGWVSNSEFVSVGINHFKFWTIDQKMVAKQSKIRGNFVSLAIGDGIVLTGGSAGTIYSWKAAQGKPVVQLQRPEKQKPQQKQPNYASVVQSIKIQKEFIAAGTKDGLIFILDKSFKKINTFIVSQSLKAFQLKSQNTSVRSLDFLDRKMLIGTFGSEIYQLQIDNLSKPNCKITKISNHLKCHYSPNNTWTNQVWGLTIVEDLIFTCSDDATVRCWSLSERKLMSCESLNFVQKTDGSTDRTFIEVQKDKKTKDFVDSSKGRSVCLSPDKKNLIVGCKDGRVKIFDFNQKNHKMKLKLTFKHAKQWISDIKFGYNMLLIGSHDNAIYVYDYDEVSGDYRRKYKPLLKHSSYITHIDVSRDSCYMQSTCGAYQILFWDLNSGKQITSGASMLRDERWTTWTCNLGWPVQGIYPKCTDGTFIHSVDRSNLSIKNTMFKDDSKTPYLLGAGNNSGRVCVYNFPCTIKNSQYVQGKGHSSHVTNVRWSNDDQYIVSVGGQDQCLMYWKIRKNK